MNRPFFLILSVVFLTSAIVASAIEITPPSIGDTEIEITDFAVAEDLAEAPKSILSSGPWFTVYWVRNTPSGSQVSSFSVRSGLAVARLALQFPVSAGDIFVAVDNWTGRFTIQRLDGKSSTLDETEMAVEGFEPGATEMRITGLAEGASVMSFITTPGTWPTQSMLEDGSWGDSDGEVNGAIVTRTPRFTGPDYVLPGEIWTLAVEGEGADPEAVTVVAEGLQTRHVVSAVSHIIGASGVPFVSDLTLSNPSGLHIDGWIKFVQDGTGIDGAASVDFALPAGETISWTDVLQSAFDINTNIKGSLVIGGYPHWLLQVSSRNYAVDSEGKRFGIAIPGEPTLVPVTGPNPWVIPGLLQNDSFRTNLLLTGLAPTTSQVIVQLVADGAVVATTSREVPPYALVQINGVVNALGGTGVEIGHLEILVESGGIAAALSVVDNSADDAAYISARPKFPQ